MPKRIEVAVTIWQQFEVPDDYATNLAELKETVVDASHIAFRFDDEGMKPIGSYDEKWEVEVKD